MTMEKPRKKQINKTNLVLVLILIAGLSIMLYPSFSDWWNSFHQSRAVASYKEYVANMDEDDSKTLLDNAKRYNKELLNQSDRFRPSQSQTNEYNSTLDVTGTGIMGYVEVPKINCTLPVYHGTDEGVLQIAIGHIEGSSLPIGGKSTHSVLSGHRGLPSARLFTDIDQLIEGDYFMVHVLDQTCTYQVDQILIVEPTDISALEIEEGKDYCTLVTCTPYGINSHRLLVRGHRVSNIIDDQVTADAVIVNPLLVALLLAIPVILLLVVIFIIRTRSTGEVPGKLRLPRMAKNKGLHSK